MSDYSIRKLETLLSNSFGNDLEIVDKKWKFLTEPGENYGSVMVALEVDMKIGSKTVSKHFVSKFLPTSLILRQAFDTQVTFKKELDAYITTIPYLIDLQKEFEVPESKLLDIFPKSYGGRLNLHNKDNIPDDDAVILLENLKLQGYVTADRFAGYDFDHAQLLVKALAKMHAIPIAARLLRPKEFEEKVVPCMVPNTGIEKLPPDLEKVFIDSVVEKSKLIPEVAHKVDKIERLVLNDVANMKKEKTLGLEHNAFSTVVHSDLWLNNTMILRDSTGKPLKCKIVDLQIMQYGSGIRDLIFFLYTSIKNPVLDEYYEKLIKIYYDTFIDYLSDFNINLEPYSWNEFLKEIDVVAVKEFYHVTFMLKPIFTEKGKVNNIAEFQPSDWGRDDLIGEAHLKKLKDTLLAYMKRNWL